MDAAVAAAVPPVRSVAARAVSGCSRRATVARRGFCEARSILSVVDHNAIDVLPRISEAEVGDYFALLKPRVMSLVIFTALVGLFIAPGHVHPIIAFTSILCIAVGAGASGVLYMDYAGDIGVFMTRLSSRPIQLRRVALIDDMA